MGFRQVHKGSARSIKADARLARETHRLGSPGGRSAAYGIDLRGSARWAEAWMQLPSLLGSTVEERPRPGLDRKKPPEVSIQLVFPVLECFPHCAHRGCVIPFALSKPP